MKLKLAIAGAAGRMGRALTAAALAAEDIIVAGGTERPGADAIGLDMGTLSGQTELGVKTVISAEQAGKACDGWIDFTAPVSTLEALDALTQTTVRAVVIGTTGFNAEEEDALKQHAERFAIVKAGNYSLGVNLVSALVEQALPAWVLNGTLKF